MRAFVTKLEYLRRSKGLSQLELARLAGVSGSLISALERGDRRLYGARGQAIARVLGYPHDRFRDMQKAAPDLADE